MEISLIWNDDVVYDRTECTPVLHMENSNSLSES